YPRCATCGHCRLSQPVGHGLRRLERAQQPRCGEPRCRARPGAHVAGLAAGGGGLGAVGAARQALCFGYHATAVSGLLCGVAGVSLLLTLTAHSSFATTLTQAGG